MKRPEIGVFLILWASYAFFWHGRDWNTASRLMLTYAIVDRGTIRIDGLDDQTGDKASYRGHFYSDKLPGFSLLAAPPYLAIKEVMRLPAHPLNTKGFAHWPADYAITLFTSGLLTAITGALLVSLARELGCGPRVAISIGLAYGLATPAYAYATLAYGHQAASACLLGSFALLWRTPRRRVEIPWAVAGFLAAYASVIELQVGPVAAILGMYAIALAIGRVRPVAGVFAFGIGAVVPTLLLLMYNWVAFDSPLRMGYFFHAVEQFRQVHSAGNPLGLGRPDWSKLDDLLIRPARGLLWYAPILILTLPGVVALIWRRFFGMAIVCAATMAAVLLVNLSYPEWTGGWSTGPRLLVPLLPFAMLPVAGLLAASSGVKSPPHPDPPPQGGRGQDNVEPRNSPSPLEGEGRGGGSRRVWGSPGRWIGRAIVALAVVLTLVGAIVILAFQGVGARIPDPIRDKPPGLFDPLADPLLCALPPIYRGEPLPGWVFGQRYARNVVSIVWPERVAGLAPGRQWLQFAPLVVFQVLAIGVLLLVTRPTARRDAPPVAARPPAIPDPA